jgi:hypothetical protein
MADLYSRMDFRPYRHAGLLADMRRWNNRMPSMDAGIYIERIPWFRLEVQFSAFREHPQTPLPPVVSVFRAGFSLGSGGGSGLRPERRRPETAREHPLGKRRYLSDCGVCCDVFADRFRKALDIAMTGTYMLGVSLVKVVSNPNGGDAIG